MTATVLPIRPEATEARITRWRGLLDPNGTQETVTWSWLFDRFAKVRPFLGKESHPGWSAAVFDGDKRAKAGVERVTAAVLDYDATASLERALASWGDNYGFLHTTKSHTVEVPRFRIILPLRRPVSAFEWDILWARLQEHCDGATDPQAKDASRFWYEPGIPDDGVFWSTHLKGLPLDPDAWLRKAPKSAPVERPTPARISRPSGAGPSPEERASKYVAKMPHAISGQNGHGSTWRVAITCARGFALGFDATLAILREHNACCEPRWTEGELRHKASDALKADVPLGYLLDRKPPGWREPESYFSEPERRFDEDGVLLEDHEHDREFVDPQALEDEATPAPRNPPRSLAEMFADVLAQAESGVHEVGVSCCHYKIDHLLAGFRPQMVTVMGARTSFGKSSYAIMVADEAMRRGEGVLVISAEDSERTFAQRFMARRAKVSAFNLRANQCKTSELDRMREQTKWAEQVPFFVDAVGKPAEWIAATIREECARASTTDRKIKLVIVDYLQRIGALKRTQDVRTKVTFAMECITDAIKESNSAGLVLSQLKRLPNGGDAEPDMTDLKESGDIENMAEHIILGWSKDDDAIGDAEPTRKRFMKIPKNKDGPVDTRAIDITFDEATASFKVASGTVIGTTYDQFDDQFDDGDQRHP